MSVTMITDVWIKRKKSDASLLYIQHRLSNVYNNLLSRDTIERQRRLEKSINSAFKRSFRV